MDEDFTYKLPLHALPYWLDGELWLPMRSNVPPPLGIEAVAYGYSASEPNHPLGSVGYAATYFNFTKYIKELIHDSPNPR